MMKRSTRGGRISTLLALLAAALVVGAVASDAEAGGPSPQHLAAQGWTCIVPPPFPETIACFNPGHGAPFPGNPDPPPSYSVLNFDRSSGAHISNVHLIRADLYAGQPCAGGDPYRFIPRIGYYECVREHV
jgi:hypothetical protein